MAYNKKKLMGHIGTGAISPTLFLYSTDDTLAVASGADYFNDSADIFKEFDIIQCHALTFGILRVVSNDGTTVVVAVDIQEV